MIQTFKITNELGESITIDLRKPAETGFYVKSIEGLGPAKATINTTEALSIDGAFYNSSRVGSRNLVLTLGFYYWISQSIETTRQQTYRFFPPKRPLDIEIQTDNRLGVTTGYVETNEPDIFSRDESAVISIICPDAFFYGKEIIQTVFSGTDAAFEFPFENPSLTEPLIEFGNIFIDTSKNVFYAGDVPTGVTVYVNFLGNVHNLAIYNATRNQAMTIDSAKLITLTGSDFVSGDQLIISTIKGKKFVYLVRGGLVLNILNALDTDAQWFTIDRGDNVFTYTADSGISNMQFMIEHQIVYGGL